MQVIGTRHAKWPGVSLGIGLEVSREKPKCTGD